MPPGMAMARGHPWHTRSPRPLVAWSGAAAWSVCTPRPRGMWGRPPAVCARGPDVGRARTGASGGEGPMDEQMARAMAMADVGAAAAMCGLGGERVRVKRDEESGERGLYATADFGEGEPIGSVPVAACLLVDDTRASAPNVDDASAFARLHAPTAMETVLPWPVRAAAALLDLADGAGGTFHAEYAKLLPKNLPVPLMLPADALDDATLAAEMQLQREELLRCYPTLLDDSDRLVWAAACVRSRAFALNQECSLHALVPFLDMLNHHGEPNASVVAEPSATEPLVAGAAPRGFVTLVATREIRAGEEICIRYDGDADADAFYVRYGFRIER